MPITSRRAEASGDDRTVPAAFRGPGPVRVTLPGARRGRARGSLLAAAALLPPLVAGCGSEAPETAVAALGTVSSSVTANGNLRFVDRVSIGFPEGGKIAAIKVKVGDRVVPGQPVAQVEDLAQRVAVRQAQAKIKIEEQKLAKLIANNAIDAAEDEAEFTEELRSNAEDIREENIEAEKSAVREQQAQLAFDRRQLDRQRAELARDDDCLADDSDLIMPGIQPSEECLDRINAREDAIENAKRTILETREDLRQAQNDLDVARATQRLSVTAAERTETAEQHVEDKARIDRPFDIEVQRQILDQARAEILLKQRELDKTIKPSSYSGTVDGINGQVGQVMRVAHRSPLAPGAPAAAGGAPAGDKLITLKDVNAYQVEVAYSAADGAKITKDQSVEVAFDEVPGLVSPARVADIVAPVPGVDAGYRVTVVLNEVDPRLADGMAARVNVAVAKLENALSVPASAVRVNGRIGTVAVSLPDGGVREMPVELGMIGAKAIEIKSGIAAGDVVRVKHPG